MKITMALSLLLISLLFGISTGKEIRAHKHRSSIEKKQSQIIQIDFGEVEPATAFYEHVALTNASFPAIEVTKIKPSCGCIGVKVGKTTIKQQDDLNLGIGFKAPNKIGPFRRDVDIFF